MRRPGFDAKALARFEHRFVTSTDGTEIAYRQYGTGPGVIVVHGGMQAAHNLTKLSVALVEAGLPVHLVQRRGRGRSGPFGPSYDADKARQDLAAVVADTAARWMFALSAGATIALYTAVKESAIEKLAVYEPPLSVFRPMVGPWFAQYEREVDEGRIGAAMVTLIKSDLGIETRLKVLPRFFLERLFVLAIAEDAKKAGDDRVPLGQIAAYLAERLSRARRVDLRGVGHLAADDDGQPSRVAKELLRFFD